MTRRDYQLLTDVLRHEYLDAREREDETEFTVLDVAKMLGIRLARDNKAFDKDKFINDIRGL